ncbi:MAG: hypothetical protein CMJ75_14805 [Planctomycetaceae bacterium]|nr:hypothetical protein [Planctomycetaceae bacterium]
MPLREFIVLSLWALWIGGLTFYALIVVPIGGELLGETQQGFITQQVTQWLNGIGIAALLTLAWSAAARPGSGQWLNLTLLAALQAGLLLVHRQLGPLLDAQAIEVLDPDRFYEVHRVYLILTTFQWLLGWRHLWLVIKARAG